MSPLSDPRATAYGIYYFVVGLFFLVANTIVGALWEYLRAQAAFTYSLVTPVMAVVGMALFLYARLIRV